jgi:hypothetical protein
MTKTDLSEMLRCGLFRFVAGNVSLGPEGELIVTDGRFLAGVTFQEIDELRHKLAGEAAHIKSLEGLLVDAVRERDLIKNHYSAEAAAKLRAELASARAEVEMLRGVGCREAKAGELESGPCGVCLRCTKNENARLRAALLGLLQQAANAQPFAQWTREMHAAHIALESAR